MPISTEPTVGEYHNHEDATSVVADLARREADAEPLAVDNYAWLVREREDEQVYVRDMEAFQDNPARARGTAYVSDPSDFAAYVARLADASTTVWASLHAAEFRAVFNDHEGPGVPGWRDHSALCRLQVDPDWKAWKDNDGRLAGQLPFAEFLEDRAHTITSPDAATMLEVALTFNARRHADFSQATRLASGDVQLKFHEDTKATAGAKGTLEVPEQITLLVAPYQGTSRHEVTARLRWRINDGHLQLGYRLIRPDQTERAAFDEAKANVIGELDKLDVPLFDGNGPIERTSPR